MSHPSRIKSYRDLKVWQRGIDLVEHVYRCSSSFPEAEKFGLTAQLRRAAISIPSNIAEGWGRGTRNAYLNHLRIAKGSLAEVETQLIIAHRLDYLSVETLQAMLAETEIEGKMLVALIHSLRK